MTVMTWASVQPGDLDWQRLSRCQKADPELFHPESHKRADQEAAADQVAAEWCRRCPVVAACRAFAEERGAVGVWGGTLRSVRGAEPRVVELPSMQPQPAPPSACGTTAGYHRHMRRSEMPCAACYEARAASLADRRRRISSERESA